MRGEKTALKIADKYRENLEKGAESRNADLDNLLSQLSAYQNKSGTISRSKTRSKKAQKAVRDLLKNINQYKTAKSRQAKNKAVAEAASTLEKTLGLSGPAGKAAAEVFVSHTKGLLKVIRDSEVILALAQAGFGSKAIEETLAYIKYQMESSVPDEMRKFVSEDDISIFISNMENIKELYPDMNVSDIITVADRMQTYGFDNVETAVEDYMDEMSSSGNYASDWDPYNEDDDETDDY